MDWSWFTKTRKAASRYGRQEAQRLLHDDAESPSPYPALAVTKVALKLKYQIEQVVPCELEEWKIAKANSPVITQKVIQAAKEAGGAEHAGCIIYCLLVCLRWFQRQAELELWDADLFQARAVACEVLAKKIIESSEDREEFLQQEYLLRRYAILVRGRETDPANSIERAVDLHALRVISSSGYQKCVDYLWRGWLIQDEDDPSRYKEYKDKANPSYWAHFSPDRMRTPQFQNAVQISVSLIYLVLYTIAINTINKDGDLDVIEGILYLFTAGFIFDEVTKLWKDEYYISFWNVFNSLLYTLLLVSFVLRLVAYNREAGSEERGKLNMMSYNFLAVSAPMFWGRLLLYLDAFRWFGSMLVILKVMMKESAIFFLLLALICIGFLQAFIGLDQADDNRRITKFIIQAMANSVMQSPDFDGFDPFAPPFGIILYYIFTFVVMVVLLNILIALYNSAYENVTANADDEYMGLFAAKTMQFIRAPDENVFIAPFNLIEVFGLVLPLEWWMPEETYERINDIVMLIIYSPLLVATAYLEARAGRMVLRNRSRNQEDADTIEEWEELGPAAGEQADGQVQGTSGEDATPGGGLMDFEADGWAKTVEASKPNVYADATILEVRELKKQVTELTDMMKALKEGGG